LAVLDAIGIDEEPVLPQCPIVIWNLSFGSSKRRLSSSSIGLMEDEQIGVLFSHLSLLYKAVTLFGTVSSTKSNTFLPFMMKRGRSHFSEDKQDALEVAQSPVRVPLFSTTISRPSRPFVQ
jgi:hypothetical protein